MITRPRSASGHIFDIDDNSDSDPLGLLEGLEDGEDADYGPATALRRRDGAPAHSQSTPAPGMDSDDVFEDDNHNSGSEEDAADALDELRRGPELQRPAPARRHQGREDGARDGLEWNRVPVLPLPPPQRPLPRLELGLPQALNGCATFSDFFLKLVPLEECGKYYLATLKHQLSDASGRKNRPISWHEWWVSLGVLTYIGLHSITGEKMDLWSAEPILGHPVVSQSIARNRFKVFWQFVAVDEYHQLGAAELAERQQQDPFFRVRSFMRTLFENSRKHYQGCGTVTLDELVVRCGARTDLARDIRGKPIPHGVLMNALATTDGYLLSAIAEKDSLTVEAELHYAVLERWLTQETVDTLSPSRKHFLATFLAGRLSFLSQVPPFRLLVTMDNLQNSVALVKVLVQLGCETNGTLRLNFGPSVWQRGGAGATIKVTDAAPIAVFEVQYECNIRHQRKEVMFRTARIIGTGNHAFHMLTSSPRVLFAQVNNPQGAHRGDEHAVFDLQDLYNHSKSGVDINDQRAKYYEIRMRSVC